MVMGHVTLSLQRGLAGMPSLGSAPVPSSQLQRGPFEGNGVLLNKANIHLTGSSVACRLVLAGTSTALSPSSLSLLLSPSSLLFPPLFLSPVLPSFFSVAFSSSSYHLPRRVFAGLGCTEELGEEGEAQLEPHMEGPR